MLESDIPSFETLFLVFVVFRVFSSYIMLNVCPYVGQTVTKVKSFQKDNNSNIFSPYSLPVVFCSKTSLSST